MGIVYFGVTPSNCAESGDCGGSATCVPQPGTCVYYSGNYLAGPNIQEGDNFNTVALKLNNYITSLINGSGTITGAVNLGAGARVYESLLGSVLQFRSITQGSGIIITELANEIQISASGVGGSDTAISVGGAVPIYKTKAGTEFQFRSVIGEDLIQPTQVGDTIKFAYLNKDKFALSGDSVRIYPAGTYIEKIVINPASTISSFKIGTSYGNDDVVTDQPIAGLTYTTLIVEKYFGVETTLYIQGVSSNTTFLVFKEFSL